MKTQIAGSIRGTRPDMLESGRDPLSNSGSCAGGQVRYYAPSRVGTRCASVLPANCISRTSVIPGDTRSVLTVKFATLLRASGRQWKEITNVPGVSTTQL